MTILLFQKSLQSPSSPHPTDGSRQDSLVSSESDVDLTVYQDALEGVLAWLLEAEEALGLQGKIGADVQNVKVQFHKHEVRRDVKRKK